VAANIKITQLPQGSNKSNIFLLLEQFALILTIEVGN